MSMSSVLISLRFPALPKHRINEKNKLTSSRLSELLNEVLLPTVTMSVSFGGDRWDRGLGRNAAIDRTSTLDESLDQIYRRRRTSPPALVHLVRGSLSGWFNAMSSILKSPLEGCGGFVVLLNVTDQLINFLDRSVVEVKIPREMTWR